MYLYRKKVFSHGTNALCELVAFLNSLNLVDVIDDDDDDVEDDDDDIIWGNMYFE